MNNNETKTVNEILVLDSEKMMKAVKLMPLSLAQFINKRHKDLIPVDECMDRFEDAVQACRDHKEAFSFIPEKWTEFMIEIKLNLALNENPTNEPFMDDLIKLKTARFAHIAKIMNHPDNDYDESDLLEMDALELRDVRDELEPIEITSTCGTAGGGTSTRRITIKKAA